ncbi:uncharacterized protein LOC141632380 [Silene latifolia]|uniref:uncharacterized protein LOC141632380 n=1 Tax=Silene latifolia TaxID=37657 RepID=UPI003D77037A
MHPTSVFDRISPPAEKCRPSIFTRLGRPSASTKHISVFTRLGNQGESKVKVSTLSLRTNKKGAIHERLGGPSKTVFSRLGAPKKNSGEGRPLLTSTTPNEEKHEPLKARRRVLVLTGQSKNIEPIPSSSRPSGVKKPGDLEVTTSSYHITVEEIPGENEEVEADEAPETLEDGDPRPIYVSALLNKEEEEVYYKLLVEYKDVFAWSYSEMPGLSPKIAVHRLAIKKGTNPKKQPQRRFRPELVPEIEKEVNKLIEAGFIREVKYSTWIANIVPVRKKNGQLHICVDFRDLNDACPKDDFPLPVTELMIDATTGYEALSFMDCTAGFVVRHRGIEIDQTKIKAINEMPEPKTLKELRGLQGRLAYIRSIKKYLASAPVLGAPIPGRPLVLYIAAQERSLGAMCAQKIEDRKERALYYLSCTLVGAELNYAPIEKICLALVFAIQKLRQYMQAHTIHVVSKADPIKYILLRPVLSGRLAKWAMLLKQYDLVFVPQKAVKGQAIADFFADHPVPAEWEISDDLPGEEIFYVDVLPPWQMYFDGAARQDGAGAGVVFVTPQNHIMPYAFTLTQLCTNNMAEYQALILGLQMAIEIGVRDMDIYGDSKLVVNQVLGEYEVKKEDLIPYHQRALQLLNQLDDIHVGHVPRSANKLADTLANLAATLALGAEESMQVPVCNRWAVSLLEGEENVDTTNMICVYTAEEDDWRQPIIDFLDHQKLPDDPRHKVEIRRRAPKFIHYKGTLYRRSFSGQWLRCLSKDEAVEAMHEAHSGICGAHQSGPKLHDRVKRMRYYWPTMEGLTEDENDKLRLAELEALDEKRLEAQKKLQFYQARLSRAFNKKEVYTNGAYKIVDEDGVRVGPINGKFLKRYYS